MERKASPGWQNNPEYVVDTALVPARVKVVFGGETLAETDRALLVMELGHGPVYYLPKEDVEQTFLTPTEHSTYCQYKGFATYWTVSAGGKTEENAAWAYAEPFAEVAPLDGHIGLYWHKMDAWYEDDVQVAAPRDIAGRCDAKKSFRALYPALAREWHPQRNPNVWPYECAPWFKVVVWWRDEAGREWQQSVRDRVLAAGGVKAA